MDEEIFETEMKKLRALNTATLEAWQRIHPLYSEEENCLVFECLKKLRVEDNQLFLESSREKFPLPSFSPCFKNVVNIFKETLPEKDYFDLSEAIGMLEVLKTQNALKYVPSWIDALQRAKSLVGELEGEAEKKNGTRWKVEKLFGIPEGMNSLLLAPQLEGFKCNNLSVEFDCKENVLVPIEKMREYFFSCYKVERYFKSQPFVRRALTLDEVSSNLSVTPHGNVFTVKKKDTQNTWNANVATGVLEKGIHECKVTLVESCERLMIGVHNFEDFCAERSNLYNSNGKYLFCFSSTEVYGDGENTHNVGVGASNQNGTIVKMNFNASNGEISWQVNNNRSVVKRCHHKGPWRISFCVATPHSHFTVQFI